MWVAVVDAESGRTKTGEVLELGMLLVGFCSFRHLCPHSLLCG